MKRFGAHFSVLDDNKLEMDIDEVIDLLKIRCNSTYVVISNLLPFLKTCPLLERLTEWKIT